MDEVRQDVGFAMRQLRRNPAFAVLAVLTLALGIGANTAIFSAVQAVVLRPLALEDPDRLVILTKIDVDQGRRSPQLSYPDFVDIRQQNEVFEDAGAAWIQAWTLTGDGAPDNVRGTSGHPRISGNPRSHTITGTHLCCQRIQRPGRGNQSSVVADPLRLRPGSGRPSDHPRW